MPVFQNARARWHMEQFWEIVRLGEGRVIESPFSARHVFGERSYSYLVKAVRLDVVIDDGPDGFARSFAHLLAGLKFNAEVPTSQRPLCGDDGLTFVNATLGSMLTAPADLDKPTMRHAIAGPFAKDWSIATGAYLQMTVEYRGPPIPLAFLRVVPAGVGTEAVQ